ncbi:death on curing protein [Enterococcus sp. DIV0840]|uniref:type II toxin-antitoxin system death-on-curing family toxin n=1 Tax=Enterococcus TaxID=1350 RepID=UPI001A8FF4F6|nr:MULTISPECIES: type II toxin-antitoxin system death-on-curing family toxin [Enterococcus]MBO0433188.1 type II toxin-antitoxin system death-on-curing family toxin [Enterococcus sp. DIV0849a]MBO0473653.1 type II toxin-antitoxin system death-on-curing family toxin [Enterococcus ureasiticus]
MKYLTIEEIIAMNYALIKCYSPREVIGVREMDALEMVVAQPKQEVFGKELYPTIFDKAYILYKKLIKKHCFHNGNKCTAVLALLVFLKRNGLILEVKDSELEDMSVGIAINEFSQEEVVSWMKKCCRI